MSVLVDLIRHLGPNSLHSVDLVAVESYGKVNEVRVLLYNLRKPVLAPGFFLVLLKEDLDPASSQKVVVAPFNNL